MAIVAPVLVVGGLAGLIAWLASRAKKNAGGGKTTPGKKPTDPTTPGGGGGGGGGNGGGGSDSDTTDDDDVDGQWPRRGPNGGWIWGVIDNEDIPGDWDPMGNKVRVSGDCQVVLVGEAFWPDSKFVNAIEPQQVSVAAALAIPGNSILGYVDASINAGETSSQRIAAGILLGVSPWCDAMPASDWSEGMRDWFEVLLDRLDVYVEESVNGIDPGELGVGGSKHSQQIELASVDYGQGQSSHTHRRPRRRYTSGPTYG